jgi:hypothetical protein
MNSMGAPETVRPLSLLMKQPLIVDAHEDIAWNILVLGRDYTRSVRETRALEKGSENVVHNGETLLGWPEYQQGRVAFVFGTLFAAPKRRSLGAWDTQVYRPPSRPLPAGPQPRRFRVGVGRLADGWEESSGRAGDVDGGRRGHPQAG